MYSTTARNRRVNMSIIESLALIIFRLIFCIQGVLEVKILLKE